MDDRTALEPRHSAEGLELSTRQLEEKNVELVGALSDARLARVRAEAMARQKARVAAFLDAALVSAPVGFPALTAPS